jgi:hypothetical protein
MQKSERTVLAQGMPNVSITIQSPENKTYTESTYNGTLPFVFIINSSAPPIEFGCPVLTPFLYHGCVLDCNTVNLTYQLENTPYWQLNRANNISVTLTGLGDNLYRGNATLTNLSQGSHNITVWVVGYLNYLSYAIGPMGYNFTTLSFNIDSIPPNVTILSPQLKTYKESSVPLTFTTDKLTSKTQYSLDGKKNVTFTGNLTLTDLSNGSHNVTVYATDLVGNTGSQTVDFIVENQSALMVVVVAVPVVVLCLIAGLLLYRRHRKTANLSSRTFSSDVVYSLSFYSIRKP